MNLHYEILWVDDDEGWYASLRQDDITSHIEDAGFVPKITPIIDVRQIGDDFNYSTFDLLVIDFNLSDAISGSNLIQRVREHRLLTEVIFYTQQNRRDLIAEATAKELEGVFYSSRPDIIQKVKDVFDLTIRKILDVNNMRGLVMAEIAELDLLVSDIIGEKHRRLDGEKQEALVKKIVEKLTGQIKTLQKLEGKIPKMEKLLEERLFDSMKRIMTVINLCKQHTYLKPHQEKITSYTDMLHWRNALAHQRPTVKEGIPHFRLHDKEYRFDEARGRVLRKELREYREKFAAILDAIRDA